MGIELDCIVFSGAANLGDELNCFQFLNFEMRFTMQQWTILCGVSYLLCATCFDLSRYPPPRKLPARPLYKLPPYPQQRPVKRPISVRPLPPKRRLPQFRLSKQQCCVGVDIEELVGSNLRSTGTVQ